MTTYLRPSMLPGYQDCARRGAAKQWTKEIESAGYILSKHKLGAGAGVGIATHAVLADMLYDKMTLGTWSEAHEYVAAGMVAFNAVAEEAGGWEPDKTTQTSADVQLQIGSLSRSFEQFVIRDIEPDLIEYQLSANLGEDYILSGTLDLLTKDGTLIDHKTGTRLSSYLSQLGAYSLMLQSNGYQVSSIKANWLKRVPANKFQPAPQIVHYNQASCESAAAETIKRVKKESQRFFLTGDPASFPANPMSVLCSEKWCPAWGGSTWCNQWNGQIKNGETE